MQQTFVYVGIDPDLHSTAIVTLEPRSVSAQVLRVPVKLKGADAALAMARLLREHSFACAGASVVVGIELQEIVYSSRSGVNPRDLLHLAWVSGAAMAAASDHTVYCWLPQQWKGTVPKTINQARSYDKMGWTWAKRADYCVPNPLGLQTVSGTKINPGDWKHLGDALGLALKVKEQSHA